MPENVQYIPVVPAPNFTVGSNEEQGIIVLVVQSVYGDMQFLINPNSAIELSRAVFKTAKALNLKLAARAGQSVQGRDARSGGILLSKPAVAAMTEAEGDTEFVAEMEDDSCFAPDEDDELAPSVWCRPRAESFVGPEAASGFAPAVPQHGTVLSNDEYEYDYDDDDYYGKACAFWKTPTTLSAHRAAWCDVSADDNK